MTAACSSAPEESLDGSEIDDLIRQCGRTPHDGSLLAATAGDARA